MATLAVDPGDTTGIALIGRSGDLLKHWQMSHEEFVDWLASGGDTLIRRADIAVVEDFQLLPHKGRAVSQKHSRKVSAARGIGVMQMWAAERGIELIFRDPSHWRIGLQLAGIAPADWPKDHATGHHMCAYGAGFHALVEYGLVETRVGSLQ